MLQLVLVCALLALVKTQSTNVQQCTITAGNLPLNTLVENCPNPPCQIKNDEDAVLHLIFKAPHLIRSMETRVFVQLPSFGNIAIPYNPEEYGVTCNFLSNSYCPILPGEVLQYTLRMTIPAAAVGQTAIIEFSIVDQDEKYIACIRLPVSVS